MALSIFTLCSPTTPTAKTRTIPTAACTSDSHFGHVAGHQGTVRIAGFKAKEKWGEWAESLGSEYSRMRYESGEPCLHGPTRNTLVTLTCALETALRSVREPGRCQYIMDLHTPAACRPPRTQKGVHSEL
ncbi:unnamed protein product [Boreogadus saida]